MGHVGLRRVVPVHRDGTRVRPHLQGRDDGRGVSASWTTVTEFELEFATKTSPSTDAPTPTGPAPTVMAGPTGAGAVEKA